MLTSCLEPVPGTTVSPLRTIGCELIPPTFLTANERGVNSDPEFRFDEGWPELFAEALERASRRPPGTSELSFAMLHLSLEVRRAPAVVFRIRIRFTISRARQMSYGGAVCD